MELARGNRANMLGAFVIKYISVIAFLVLLLFNCLFTSNFVSTTTFTNIITQASKVTLLGLGMTLVIATGGIDISVGSAMGVSAILSAIFLSDGNTAGLLISLAVVLLFGALNGIFVAKFSILPMVVTLAMRYIMRGVAKGVSGRGTISFSAPWLTKPFLTPLGGVVPLHFFIMLAAIVVMYLVVNRMEFGARVEAYGNNPLAARISGIHTVRIVVLCYVVSALFAWMAGSIDMIMVSSADPSKIGLDMETDAIAATLIGGTPITGGYPNILGTVGGAFLLQLITMMCNMNNIAYSYSLMIKASIIVFALFFHSLRKTKVWGNNG